MKRLWLLLLLIPALCFANGPPAGFLGVDGAGANITTTIEPYHEQIGSAGNVQSRSGGESRGQSERVLEQGQQYAVCITSSTADDSHHNIVLDWYEHTNRN